VPAAAVVVAVVVDVLLTVVGVVVVVDEDLVDDDDDDDDEDVEETVVPDPIAVVMVPDSMYTPEKYQSSVSAVSTMRRTPKCQSSEFVDVEAAMFEATLTSGLAPVDAHSPTVPPLKSMSYAKLYQVPATKVVPHLGELETCHSK